jgi:hypothetical protein
MALKRIFPLPACGAPASSKLLVFQVQWARRTMIARYRVRRNYTQERF